MQSHGIETARTQLFNKATVEFSDTHALPLALVEADEAHTYDSGENIIGFHGVSMLSIEPYQTVRTLNEDMGLELIDENERHIHLETKGEWRHHVIVQKKLPMCVYDGVLVSCIILPGQYLMMRNTKLGK